MGVFARGLKDTVHGLGKPQGIVLLIATPILGCLILGLTAGERVMNEEWMFVIAGLAAVGAMALVFLIYNTAAAPYRIARDNLAEAKDRTRRQGADIEALQHQVADLRSVRPQLELSIEGAWYGGKRADRPNDLCLCPTVRVANVGGAASAAVDWAVVLVSPAGEPIVTYGEHVEVTMNFAAINGPQIAVGPSELIYEKTKEPVAPGAVTSGILLAYVNEADVAEGLTGCVLTVECSDVFGRRIVSPPIVFTGQSMDRIAYNPLIKMTRGSSGNER
jgi:hypothetical protein